MPNNKCIDPSFLPRFTMYKPEITDSINCFVRHTREGNLQRGVLSINKDKLLTSLNAYFTSQGLGGSVTSISHVTSEPDDSNIYIGFR